jgi:hypothetical protein
MFSSVSEYKESLKVISSELKGFSERAGILGLSIKSLLTDYTFTSVDERFFKKDFGGEIVNDEKVGVSLAAALAGNLGNLGKTYGDLYKASIEEDSVYSAIELSTSTGAKIELIIFKGDDMSMSFDEDGIVKVYGIIIRMDKNKQFVNSGNFYGRTLNLYADVPTFVYAPSNGVIHGIANYSKVLDLANDEEEEDELNTDTEVNNSNSTDDTQKEKDMYPSDAIFVIYDSDSERYIPREEGNIIDWDYYYGIVKMGYDYNTVLLKDLSKNNIQFPEGSELEDIRQYYKKPLVNYKYQNRERCALTTFYADSQNVETLRLDITGTRSTVSAKSLDSFTSCHDYEKVDRVFTVIPNESFSYDIELNAADYIAGLGYRDSDRLVFIQSRTYEELEDRVAYLKKSYLVDRIQDGLYQYKDEDRDWNFKAFLCGPDFKFVDEVPKL